MRRGRAHEGNGAVALKEVRAGGVSAAETAVDRRVTVSGKVVVRTVDAVSKSGIRSPAVVGPVGRNAAPDITATGGSGGAEVRAVVALRPTVGTRSSGIADVQAVDRDVLFTDNDLIAETVGNTRDGVARLRARGRLVASRDTRAAEEAALIRLAAVGKDLGNANVVVVVAVSCSRAAIVGAISVS